MTTDRPPGLAPTEQRVLSSVCETLLPRLTPAVGDSAELFALSATDVGLSEAVADAMAALSAAQQRDLRLFLRLLDRRGFMFVAARRPTAFPRLEADQREAALLALANSPLPQLRTGFQALKRLAAFLFYSVPREAGVNPTYRALGYALPPRIPAIPALTVTRVTKPSVFDADACIVGSGAGGGVVAQRLAAAGLRVVVLESGPPDQAGDFDQREMVGMQRLYLDQGTTATRDLSVAILAGSCLGGGTTVNWQTSLRLPDFIRDEWADLSGIRAFSDASFSDAMDAVSARAGVGTDESTRNANNAPLKRGCAALGYRCIDIPRNARGCDLSQCGYCVFGCRVGGKQSTANTFLVDAQRSGETTIVASCRAETVVVEGGRAAAVQATATDADGLRHTVRVNARTVVVAAGAVGTPALLLRSGIRHPMLGRNLFLHPTSAVAGRYDEPIRAWIGAPQTVLCDEFARQHGHFGNRVETAPMHPGLIAMAQPWYGARDHRMRMQHAAHVSAFIVITRDRDGGRVRVDRDGRAVISYSMGRMERQLMRQGLASAARVHWAAGASEIHTLHSREHTFRRASRSREADIDAYCARIARASVHGNRCAVFSAHQMGTCRMGTDRRASVCDERGQLFGTPGLYVADASLFPASSGVNPMITIMALAHMVGGAIVDGLTV